MEVKKLINMVQRIKEICKNFVVIVEIGNFYYCFGKDTYIINYLENYKVKILENNIYSISFPKTAYNKVISNLEEKRINHLVLDRRNNYEESVKAEYKNLNCYEKYYKLGKAEISIKMRMEKIINYLKSNNTDKELIIKIESLINERRKI